MAESKKGNRVHFDHYIVLNNDGEDKPYLIGTSVVATTRALEMLQEQAPKKAQGARIVRIKHTTPTVQSSGIETLDSLDSL